MNRRIVKLAACAVLPIGADAGAQTGQESEHEAASGRASSIHVIELDYADAEEVAFALSQVLPPTIRVVAYRPTNSLIVVADPVIVADIANGDRD